MFYAVIDTNVLVSALISSNEDAATVQLVRRMISGEIVPIYSEEIMQEYKEVLSRKKFGFELEPVEYMLRAVAEYGIKTDPEHIDIVLPDIKYKPFYEVVMDTRDNGSYLVTGNIKHFPIEPFVVTARQMLNIMDNKL